MWLLFAFAGPVAWAISTHIDKYLVEKYFKDANTAVLMVFTALLGLLVMPFIAWFQPDVLSQSPISIAVMMASGILYVGAMLFYLQAIQTDEASVVLPLFQLSAVWGYLLAFVLLGETTDPIRLVGGALILAASAVLAFDAKGGSRRLKAGLILRMAACTFALALSTVIFKFFAVHDDYWVTTFWTFAGQAIFGAGILLVPGNAELMARLVRTHTTAIFSVNAANELINLGGFLGSRYALLLAPVVLVQAVTSTTPLFTFGFGVLITLFLPKFGREDLSRHNLIQKGIGATLVAVGVALVSQAA
jgi:uncharacterized membrane protein